jgi:pathogenesis-related protein 1
LYKKVYLGIITILATAAILTFLSLELQLSYAQTNQDLERKILEVHNAERRAVGVAPLTWSSSLASDAQTWANHLAATGKFAHDPVHTGLTCTGPCYGENIAGFFRDVSEPDGGQSKWVAEKSLYRGGPVTQSNLYDVGHYTQMVWQYTKQVGCATAPPNGQAPPAGHAYSILVCRYDPPGNYPNQLPYPAAAPSQAVGEEQNTFPSSEQSAPPGESGGGGVEQSAPPGESGGGGVEQSAPPGESGSGG